MNRWILPVCLLFLLASCDHDSSSGGKHSKKILQAPPYAGVTDSIREFPKQGDLYLRRAVLLSQHNEHELANEDYSKAWSLNPDESTATLYVSNLLMVEDLRGAINLLEDCIKRFPRNRDFMRRLGEIYVQTGQQAKAMRQFDEQLAKDSADFEAWYEKGQLLSQLQDTAGAIYALRKAYRLLPINHTGVALANIYAASLNPAAITICNELIAKDTAGIQTDPFFIKGTYYSDTHQYDSALKAFEECIKRDWKFTDAYIEKGIVLYEQNHYDTALSVFAMAATVSNTNADAYFWMGRCYEKKGNTDEAIQNYQRAVSLDRNFKEAMEAIRRLRK